MMEKIYTFGKDARLMGVLANPDTGTPKQCTPAVLLWNAGLLHRVGPYRLYVDLARKLASMGFLVFRFDVSGKGDSETHKDSRSYKQRAVSDIREAMDFLSTKKEVNAFVLIGLCSGADDAHSAAVSDSRVSGAVFLDGYGYRTWGYYVHHYGPRFFSLSKWKNFLRRNYSGLLEETREDEHEAEILNKILERKFPPKKDVSADLVELVARGVNLLYIYSGGVAYHYYNYRGQFKDMFRSIDFQDRLQLEYFNEAGHTYPRLRDRDKVMTTISRWMSTHYKSRIEEFRD